MTVHKITDSSLIWDLANLISKSKVSTSIFQAVSQSREKMDIGTSGFIDLSEAHAETAEATPQPTTDVAGYSEVQDPPLTIRTSTSRPSIGGYALVS